MTLLSIRTPPPALHRGLFARSRGGAVLVVSASKKVCGASFSFPQVDLVVCVQAQMAVCVGDGFSFLWGVDPLCLLWRFVEKASPGATGGGGGPETPHPASLRSEAGVFVFQHRG